MLNFVAVRTIKIFRTVREVFDVLKNDVLKNDADRPALGGRPISVILAVR